MKTDVKCPKCGELLEVDFVQVSDDDWVETIYCETCGVGGKEDRSYPTLYGLPTAMDKFMENIKTKA